MKKIPKQPIINYFDAGLMPYNVAWDLQKELQAQLIDQKRFPEKYVNTPKLNNLLMFVEHPHVYTLGKSGKESHLLVNQEQLNEYEATYVKIDRGGDITYHGPGQIVGYPILDLDFFTTDIHVYLRNLEEVMIHVCLEYGLETDRSKGETGVWHNHEKICAMGIKCSRWVTMHGFALNVNTDLSYFGHIIPCGIQNKGVTSLEKLTNSPLLIDEVKQKIIHHFGQVFGATMAKTDNSTVLTQGLTNSI